MTFLRTYIRAGIALALFAAPTAAQDTRIPLDATAWQLRFVEGVERGGKGVADGTESPTQPDGKGWAPIRVGTSWETQGYARNGVAWYRTRFTVPATWKGQELTINLGRPDDGGEAFLNGKRLGATNRFGDQLRFRVKPEDVRFGEENYVAVRVWDWYESGGLNAGEFFIERFGPAAQQPSSPAKVLELGITDSLHDDVMKTPGWAWGWRDAGTSDTRPKLSAARGALNGRDALAIRVDRTGTTEFFDAQLPPDRAGAAWRKNGAAALRFWIRSDDTEGEIQLRLNRGRYKWGANGESYLSRVAFTAGDGWRQVLLPLMAFERMTRDAQFEPLIDAGNIDNIAIGYGNNELRRKGTILIGGFEVVPAEVEPAATPINLAGLWKFSRDDTRPDGTPAVFEEKDPNAARDRLGYGVEKGWTKPEFDDAGWNELSLPGTWETQGVNYNGPAWFRRQVVVPAAWAGQTLELDLGKPDDFAEVFLNGESVGKTTSAGERLVVELMPARIKFGQANLLAVRVTDWQLFGGLTSPMSLRLKPASVGIRHVGDSHDAVSPEQFEMGAKPGRPFELVLKFNGQLTTSSDVEVAYHLSDCFFRNLAIGQAKVGRSAGGTFEARVTLTPEQSRQLYYAEWFNLKATMQTRDGKLLAAEAWHDVKLKYADRDALTLPALPDQAAEETAYGPLKLVDVIDASADPATGVHPYKAGGIRAAWVGRRAYSTWTNGVTVEQHDDRRYREANNNEFFGYRVGRGKLKPNTAYVLRVVVPDDKRRYFVMDIQAGRNYQGTGYFNGSSPDDPNGNYPITGQYQAYDHLVMNDDVTYGYRGSRTTSSENGIWVFFHDNGRAYTGQYQAGPAVAEIRLYEVGPIEKHYPEIRFPEGAPRRIMMMDWEREPEAPPADVARYARFMGFTHISPTIQKWAFGGYWNNDLGFRPPSWHKVSRDGERDEDIWDKWLAGTAGTGITLVPRVEYGGGPNLPASAHVIGPNGKIDPVGRYASWGANILAPETWEEFSRLIDDVVVRPQQKYPHVAGMFWRQRQDRIKPSYGVRDVELFCRETHRPMPAGSPEDLAKWASKTVGDAYHDWWQNKRADFIRKVRDQVKTHDPSLKLFYYHYDEDGWTLGPENNSHNSPQDWSDLYDVSTAGAFWQRRLTQLRAIPQEEFTKQVRTFSQPHMRLLPELFAKDTDLYVFAPVCRQYLSNNAEYVNYFRTGSGLSVAHIFSYEEKGRNNVQGDKYESSEMTPGGRDFAMADEVQSFFHGDPVAFTCTTYTYGRGWAEQHRRFAQAFLALPAIPGTVVPQAEGGDRVRVRTYDVGDRRYVSVASRSLRPEKLEIVVPGTGEVTDLVSGQGMPSRVGDGTLKFQVQLEPMSLSSFALSR